MFIYVYTCLCIYIHSYIKNVLPESGASFCKEPTIVKENFAHSMNKWHRSKPTIVCYITTSIMNRFRNFCNIRKETDLKIQFQH